MTHLRLIRGLTGGLALSLILLTVPPTARAQTQAATTPELTPVPDPTALAADWWTYFSSAGNALESRVAAFQDRIEALAGSLTQVGEREDRLRGLVVEIGDLAERYVDIAARKPAPAPPIHTSRETYSVDDYLKLNAAAREAVFERDLEREDIDRTARLLSASAKRIDDAKATYLELSAAVPERLDQGLELIRSRFVQAINETDLKLRRARIEGLERKTQNLEAELARAREHLAAQTGDVAEWTARATEAEQTRKRLEAEAASTRLRVSTFGDDLRERARRRRLEQRLIDYEARIVSADIDALKARLAAALSQQLLAPSENGLLELREQRKVLEAALDRLETGLTVWRKATDRERTAAMAQLAEVEASDTGFAEIHRSRIGRADETSQLINSLTRRLALGRTLSAVAGTQIADQTGWTTLVLARTGDAIEASWEATKAFALSSLFSINETPVTTLGLLRVVLIIVAAWWVSRILRHGLDRAMQRRDTMNRASIYTLGRLSHYAILFLGMMIALSSIGIDFTKFAIFVSALGVGLGFGLQAIFSNFVAGLIILFEKSLKVGDFVELESGVHGEVREINIRGTLITTNDNIDILVPNSEFVSGRVTNWTLREAYRRLRVPFGVAYGTDKELVKKAALEAAAEVPFTLKSSASRQPQVWLIEFGDSSLNFELVVWLDQDAVKRPGAVHAAYTWAIESALARHGIEIPFPQRDLHVRSYFGRKDAEGLAVIRELSSASSNRPPLAPS
jgi:small-conductance mechanosensitive channel